MRSVRVVTINQPDIAVEGVQDIKYDAPTSSYVLVFGPDNSLIIPRETVRAMRTFLTPQAIDTEGVENVEEVEEVINE